MTYTNNESFTSLINDIVKGAGWWVEITLLVGVLVIFAIFAIWHWARRSALVSEALLREQRVTNALLETTNNRLASIDAKLTNSLGSETLNSEEQ